MTIRFNNEFDIVICSLSKLLNQFEKNDQLFATQCVWWLASLVHLMDMLSYYWLYNIFPSDYPISQKKSTAQVVDVNNNANVSPCNLSDDKPQSAIPAVTDSSSAIHPERVD
jgi:hypothetical protein